MNKELTKEEAEEYYNKLWLENKELIQENMNKLSMERFELELELVDKDKEIERLNNIIKRLEKELFGMYVDIAGWDEDYAKKLIKKIEDSSQECELLKNNKKDVSIKSDELKCQFSDIWEYGDR